MEGTSLDDLLERLKALSYSKRLHLFELLAHNLTITARGAWSSPNLAPEEKVDALKRINEVLHRATARVWVERLRTHEWKDEDFVAMLGDADKALHPNLRGDVIWALKASIEAVEAQS
jgi:hypothetical protein